MRLPNSAHESRHWRIHELVPDFRLEDVWALPVEGGREDFDDVIRLLTDANPSELESLPARGLWQLRDLLGRWLDIGRVSAPAEGGSGNGAAPLPIPGSEEISLADRLPEDLRGTVADVEFAALPFVPVYRTADEFAAEIGNQTVHGAMHLAWVERGENRFQAQMAVYVKPRGAFGRTYMALIKPFRYMIVYPALMRQTERTWSAVRRARPPEARQAE